MKFLIRCQLILLKKQKKSFNERLQNTNWEIYYKDLPFNPSALSLYKWAPIAEELKNFRSKNCTKLYDIEMGYY